MPAYVVDRRGRKVVLCEVRESRSREIAINGVDGLAFEKLQGIEGGRGGCACCGYQHQHLPMNSLIAVGFGLAAVTKNGTVVYDEMSHENDGRLWTVQDAEEVAKLDPDNDWRIHLEAPLSERHYQRQGDELWVLYKKGMGFA